MPEEVTYKYYTYSLKFVSNKVGIAIAFTPVGECPLSTQLLLSLAVDSLTIAERFGGKILSLDFETIRSLIWIPDEYCATVFVMFENDEDRGLYIDELRSVGIF